LNPGQESFIPVMRFKILGKALCEGRLHVVPSRILNTSSRLTDSVSSPS